MVTALGGQADAEGQHSLEVAGRADGQQFRIIRREHRGSGVGLVHRLRADRARAVEDYSQVGLASQRDRGTLGVAVNSLDPPDGIAGQPSGELEDDPVEAAVLARPDRRQIGTGLRADLRRKAGAAWRDRRFGGGSRRRRARSRGRGRSRSG